MAPTLETHSFQAETRQLLDLMIHSLYTNKEIFLRELISNASDALDRLRFESLTRPELLEDGDKLEIRLEMDADDRTLTISDNGIGMSRQEVMDHIGTIARSGTREADGAVRIPPLTHQVLSGYVGTSREVITAEMNQLRRQGFVRYSRKAIQVYPEALTEHLRISQA